MKNIYFWIFGDALGKYIEPFRVFPHHNFCFRIAFFRPATADRTLRMNDISYGIYIYHMPIINSILYKFGAGDVQFYSAFIATIVTALVSWFFIERPCLRMKTFQARAY